MQDLARSLPDPPVVPPLGWDSFMLPAREGRLLRFLRDHVPSSRWCERDKHGCVLLHLACWGDNADVVEALIRCGLDVNTQEDLQETPAHWACVNGQSRVLEMLCAAGADLRARAIGATPLDVALENPRVEISHMVRQCVAVLVANGVRLSTAREQRNVTPTMVAFERGVLSCRSVTAALMSIKRRRVCQLAHVDKFLIREMALAIWATRRDQSWQLCFLESAEYARLQERWDEKHSDFDVGSYNKDSDMGSSDDEDSE